jgi:small subunit ribosomal protein S21
VWVALGGGIANKSSGRTNLVKILLRERESVQEAVRRFRKIVERSGLKRELRRRERYEKPSDVKRRARMRAIRRSKVQAMAAK